MIKTVEYLLKPNGTQAETLRAHVGNRVTEFAINDHPLTLSLPDLDVPIRGPAIPPDAQAVTITHHGGRWYAHLETEVTVRPLPRTGQMVGVDVGVKYLVATSKGAKVKPHADVVRLDKLIRKQQTQRDAKHADSVRWSELNRQLERNEKRLRDVQLNQANHIAKKLVEHNDIIAVEGVMIEGRGIQNDPTYKLASERASWGLLIDTIALRAREAGRTFVLVPPWWSSQTCSQCDRWVPKPMDERWHACPHCGHNTDRDQNAAQVILNRGLLLLRGDKQFKDNWFPRGHPAHRS